MLFKTHLNNAHPCFPHIQPDTVCTLRKTEVLDNVLNINSEFLQSLSMQEEFLVMTEERLTDLLGPVN